MSIFRLFAFVASPSNRRPARIWTRRSGSESGLRKRLLPSRRGRPRGELGQLSADFNYMLGEIERRDAELMVARQTLEQRVAERTEELESEIAVRHRTEGHLLEAKEAAESAN